MMIMLTLCTDKMKLITATAKNNDCGNRKKPSQVKQASDNSRLRAQPRFGQSGSEAFWRMPMICSPVGVAGEGEGREHA